MSEKIKSFIYTFTEPPSEVEVMVIKDVINNEVKVIEIKSGKEHIIKLPPKKDI